MILSGRVGAEMCIRARCGPDRGMFDSNFPPDKVGHSYNILYNAFKRLTKDYSATERVDMFRGTAERVYRVEY